MPDCGPRLSGAVQGFTQLDCDMATDFSFFMISKIPNAATIAKICTTQSCLDTMDAIYSAVPDECSIRPYGYNLYADILNPIKSACAKMPATTTPSPTKESSTEDSSLTSSPSTTSFRPSTWTPTPTPQSSSSYGYTSTSSSSDDGLDTFTVVAIIFGCVFAFAIFYAIFRSCSQSNKRDPTVQVNQNLSYGNVGDFDTIATPAYTEMKSSGDARRSVTLNKTGGAVYKTVDPSAPTATSTGLVSSTVNLSTAPDLIPLMEDEIITAARIPMDKITRGQRLSGGGYGEVFHGKYKDEVVAIKTLLPQHRNDVRRIKSFLKEVKLMATLEHERIVTFVGVAWDSVSDICVLSEFMDGGDLRSVLARFDAQHHAIGFDQNKVKIALHMAHALTYMHSLQPVVLHRDLKSSNVLLNKNMDAKITDFGISRERAESTMTRGVGTSLWMAPEVMMGGRYDEKADMFSFGVVLSELDTNKLPYATQVNLDAAKTNYVELMQSVARGRLTVEFSYESHPDIVALGRDCVAVNPAERPSAAEALHRVHQVWRQYH